MGIKRSILLSLFFVTGFFYYSQTGVTVVDSFINGGSYRKFRLYIPTSYDGTKPYPLVINLHGLSMTAEQQQLYSNFMPVADTAGFLVVHPQGTGASPYWNAGLSGGTPDDVGFLKAMIDSLQLNYNINGNAIYSCGLSNGGFMSYYLACVYPDRIAAIASVAASMFSMWFTSKPVYALPVMEIHGTEDATVPFGGSGVYMPVNMVINKWVSHNQCNPIAVEQNVPNSNTGDSCYAVNYRYSGGLDGSDVELYKIFGGSHSWPGALPVIGHTNQDFSASVEIWRFFRKYRRNQFVTNVGLKENQLLGEANVFPNPAGDVLNVSGVSDATFSVFAPDGKTIYSKIGNRQIDLTSLTPGIYFLRIEKRDQVKVLKFVKE